MSKSKVPGPPKSHFIFGNLKDFQKNPPEYILNTAKEYGNISAIDLFMGTIRTCWAGFEEGFCVTADSNPK